MLKAEEPWSHEEPPTVRSGKACRTLESRLEGNERPGHRQAEERVSCKETNAKKLAGHAEKHQQER